MHAHDYMLYMYVFAACIYVIECLNIVNNNHLIDLLYVKMSDIKWGVLK